MFAFTVRQIEIFLAVCEAGSFRGAAERIGISEAGVSNHIRALERQLDCALFARRRGAKIMLIEAGNAFREEALAFVGRGRELRAAARRHSRRHPPLKAFVGGHLLEDFIRPALPRLMRDHPEIELQFDINQSRYQAKQHILAGEYDVVLLTVPDANDMPGSILLSHVQGGIYGTERHAAQARQSGLATLPFILSPIGSDDERSERRSLEKRGVPKPLVALRTQFHDSKIRSAVDGLGVTMSIESIVAAFDPQNELRLITSFSLWERRLFLNDRVAPETRSILTGFFRDAIDDRQKPVRAA
ncbi:LysR family transcriptional regulator [Sphingomonas sp. MMS24-J13]|uniref:LysR family transcriptional regulator n=1 Tax=Sphingomonas sp. MMS24-J13 TaxID=3238686 RepID=UPI00384D9C78